MKIGIDIDGVLTDIANFQLERGQKSFGKIINKTGYEIKDIFNCSKLKENQFWLNNLDYYSLKARTGADIFTNYLHIVGIEVYIISARNTLLRKYTEYWLKNNHIYYDKIIYSQDKLKVIDDNQIDIMIEDSPKNIVLISNYIPVICMKAPYNEMINANNIFMVSSFDELYDLINNFTNKISR